MTRLRCSDSRTGRRRLRSRPSAPRSAIRSPTTLHSGRLRSSRRGPSSEITWDDVYGSAPRGPNHAWLHHSDVPDAVVAADDAEAAPWPRQPYVTAALLAGYSARFAARVDCTTNLPLGFGDHDVPRIPHADVAYYRRSHDVTLYVVPDSAHCHNFASTRARLWDRIGRWAGEQAVVPPGPRRRARTSRTRPPGQVSTSPGRRRARRIPDA